MIDSPTLADPFTVPTRYWHRLELRRSECPQSLPTPTSPRCRRGRRDFANSPAERPLLDGVSVRCRCAVQGSAEGSDRAVVGTVALGRAAGCALGVAAPGPAILGRYAGGSPQRRRPLVCSGGDDADRTGVDADPGTHAALIQGALAGLGAGGAKATLMVTMSLTDVQERIGAATTSAALAAGSLLARDCRPGPPASPRARRQHLRGRPPGSPSWR